jgi:hypothetical protein
MGIPDWLGWILRIVFFNQLIIKKKLDELLFWLIVRSRNIELLFLE